MGAALAFDPSKSPYYKVVCVISQLTYSQAVLYSSETRKWTIQEPTRNLWPSDIDYEHGVYCNGAIHWLRDRDDQMSRYDIDEDTHRFVSRPSYRNLRKKKFRYFGETGGYLQLIEIHESCVTEFDVLEMGKNYSGWFVKYYVDLNDIGAVFPEMVNAHLHLMMCNCYKFCALFLVGEEIIEDTASILLHIPNKFISYSVIYRTVTKLCDLISKDAETERSLQLGWGDAYPHIETLASV